MSTRNCFTSFVAAMLSILATPVYANTDYRCLDLCIQSGHTQYICMSQCSTDPSIASNQSQQLSGSIQDTDPSGITTDQAAASSGGISISSPANHRLLSPLDPVAGNQVLISQNQSSPPPDRKTNYICMQKCLGSKMEYDTCNDSCTTTTLKNGQQVSKNGQTQIVGAGTQPGQVMDFINQPPIPVATTKIIH